MDIEVPIQILPNGKNLPLPSYATAQSAGVDLVAAIDEDIVCQSQQVVMVPAGVALALPDGYEAQIRPRSGLAAKHGVTVLNSPGTIDADYRGEIKILLINHGGQDFVISRGMRIAQMVIAPYTQVKFALTAELTSTARGAGGFGSTGNQ